LFKPRVPEPTRLFCSFVYSHVVSFRHNLYKAIATYRAVDSGGACLNTTGQRVEDKHVFQTKYKFAIACENALQTGYCTEKILEAHKAGCIPIYYGSDTVSEDFDPRSFIHVRDFVTANALVAHIRRVDTDDTLYTSYFKGPILSEQWRSRFLDPERKWFRELAYMMCPMLNQFRNTL
jgi:hypothetical protein